jgi:hypothetical protein
MVKVEQHFHFAFLTSGHNFRSLLLVYTTISAVIA